MYTYLQRTDDGLPMRPAGPWAAVKLDYLRRYIEVFETAMRNRWPLRNYLDLMAGPGKNRVRETGEVLLGSPLLALTAKYPFTGYYFVDADAHNTEALRERCRASASFEAVHITTGDCNLIVDDIVAQIRSQERASLNLAFLDPEGLELSWETVAKLASLPRMDLVMNYPEGGLNRYMRQAYAQSSNTKVDLFFGTRDWRDIYAPKVETGRSGVHRQLIDLYKSRLQELGYQEVRQGQDFGGNEPLMRNMKQAPMYRLLFASKHELGQDFWQKVTRRDLYGQARLFEAM